MRKLQFVRVCGLFQIRFDYIFCLHETDIQICNVKPLSENGPPSEGVPLASVPSKIARFYQINDVSKFLLDRPMPKGTIDKENEFKVILVVLDLFLFFRPLYLY